MIALHIHGYGVCLCAIAVSCWVAPSLHPDRCQAQSGHSSQIAAKQDSASAKKGTLPYPYPEISTWSFDVATGKGSEAGGRVTISMKEFWNSLTYKEQQALSGKKLPSVVTFAWERINGSILPPAKPFPFLYYVHGQTGKVTDRRLVHYPFGWLKTYNVPITESYAGVKSIVTVDMKEFWENPNLMPGADRSYLIHRPVSDYVRYVRDALNRLPSDAGHK
jgi:hypothetical protein